MAKYNLITQLLLQSGDYEKGLNKAKKETQQFAQSVEKLSNGAKYLAGLAAGYLAIGTASEVAKKFINATTDSGDNFAAAMRGAEEATSELFKRIATGNMDNLLQGLKEAAELGRNYAEIMDLLENRKRSLSASGAKEGFEISQLYETYNNKTNSKDVRLNALNQIIAKEKELGETKKKIALEEYNANLSLMLNKKEWTKQEQQDLENLLLTFNNTDELRNAAIKYNEYKENANYSGAVGYNSAQYINEMKAKSLAYLNTLTKEQIELFEKYYKIFAIYSNEDDKTIDNWVNSYKNLYDVQTQVQQQTNSIIKKSSSLELGIGENEEKINEELKKELETQQQIEEILRAKWQHQDKYNQAIDKLAQITAKNNVGIAPASRNISVDKNSKGGQQLTALSSVNLDDLITRGELAAEEFTNRIADIFKQGITNYLVDSFTAIGEAMAGGGANWSKIILGNLTTVLQQLGEMAIAAGVATLGIKNAFKTLNGYAAIAAGAALLAIAGATKYLMNQQADKMGKYANGGIVGGYSFTGDKVPALVNSGEMILNQSQQARLFALANGGGNTGGTVEFEIRGDKLVGVMNNYSKKYNTVR